MRSFRELRPALQKESDSSNSSDPPLPGRALSGKPPQTQVACQACRRRKTKCDGRRPTCLACESNNRDCEYDGEPDISRTESLKRKNDELQNRAALLNELVDTLLSFPAPELAAILPRLRSFDLATDLDQLVRFIQHGEALVQLSQAGSTQHQQPQQQQPPTRPAATAAALSSSFSATIAVSIHTRTDTSVTYRLAAVLQTLDTHLSDLDGSSRLDFLQSLREQLDTLIETESSAASKD